ncbi:MAG: hypothetical protein AB7E39_05405, partial [Endomicrobiaceae bacterium]
KLSELQTLIPIEKMQNSSYEELLDFFYNEFFEKSDEKLNSNIRYVKKEYPYKIYEYGNYHYNVELIKKYNSIVNFLLLSEIKNVINLIKTTKTDIENYIERSKREIGVKTITFNEGFFTKKNNYSCDSTKCISPEIKKNIFNAYTSLVNLENDIINYSYDREKNKFNQEFKNKQTFKDIEMRFPDIELDTEPTSIVEYLNNYNVNKIHHNSIYKCDMLVVLQKMKNGILAQGINRYNDPYFESYIPIFIETTSNFFTNQPLDNKFVYFTGKLLTYNTLLANNTVMVFKFIDYNKIKTKYNQMKQNEEGYYFYPNLLKENEINLESTKNSLLNSIYTVIQVNIKTQKKKNISYIEFLKQLK